MRHLRLPPGEVALLTSSVVGPALRRRLIPATGPSLAGLPLSGRAAVDAVALPTVAAPAQHHEPAAPPTQEEPVGLGDRRVVLAVDTADETGDPRTGSSR